MFNTIQKNTNTTQNTTNKTKTTQKTTQKTTNKTTTTNTSNTITISGLSIETSAYIIQITAACIGIFVFYFVPLIANRFKRPLTSVFINVIPNALILGFFLVESEFEVYLNSCIYVPLFTTFDNIVSYLLLIYYNFTGKSSLTTNILFWLIVVIGSYFFKQ